MDDVWTVKRTLAWCIKYLENHADDKARTSAEWLLSAATRLSRVELYAYFDRPLTCDERNALRKNLKRRAKGEPLQYILGETTFRHVVVKTAPGVFIARPETEQLVQVVLDNYKGADDVCALDLGCGTGCIALSLAREAGWQVTATDISNAAIECTKKNTEMLGLDKLVTIVKSDCADGIDGPFDVLVSNPPYIPHDVLCGLPYEVVGFEPCLALDGGADGLVFFDRIAQQALRLLAPGGFFACELFETCLEKAAARLESIGFSHIEITDDLAGKPRILSARLGV